MRAQRIHNLGPNAREDSPHHVISLDTETFAHATDDTELHTLRLWRAEAAYRHDHSPSRPRLARAGGTTCEELMDWIESQVKSSPPCWLYTHNLSFDLAVTRLPVMLAERGWVISSHNLASEAPWAVLRKGTRTLRLADSHSLLPYPLAAIGAAIGMRKPPLPANDDTEQAWAARCEADAAILLEAVIEVMDWWDQHKLGHFSITGPRTGFNAMRHMCVKRDGYDPVALQTGPGGAWVQHGDGHVVIDPDPDARMFERSTLYQGRRDAWRVGTQPRGAYLEVDMHRAHLSVCATQRLPCRRGNPFPRLELDSPLIDAENIGIIADVVIESDSTLYPVRTKAGIIHPTGRFATRLAGPEIKLARDRGELREINAGWFYRMSYHMQPWGQWAERVLTAPAGQHPPAAVMAVKAWSRSVPGTWAARTSRIVMEGTSPVTGWLAEPGVYGETMDPCTIVHMAGRMQLQVRDQEADDSFPAVLSFIQSYVRVALGRMIEKVPEHRLVTCSTDSVIVDSTGWAPREVRKLRRGQLLDRARQDAEGLTCYLAEAAHPFTLAVKAVAAEIRVLSPQHVRMDGAVRYAGVAGGAEEIQRDQFRFLTWPKLGGQMGDGDSRGYVRKARTVDMSKATVPRYAFDCGCTVAARMDIKDTGNVVTGPEFPVCGRHPEAVLKPLQHPAFRGV